MTASRSFNRTRWIISGLLVAVCLGFWTPVSNAKNAKYPFEVYLDIDGIGIWIGNTIRYTVYQPTVVEARILSGTGEIILIYRLGTQQPGQYTLPWDGTADGAPLFGFFKFELYFGEEFAAQHYMTINLPESTP